MKIFLPICLLLLLVGCTNDAATPTYDNTDATMNAHKFADCMKHQQPASGTSVINPAAITSDNTDKCANSMDLKNAENEAMKSQPAY